MKAILNQEKFDHVVLQKEKKILIYYCTQGAKKGFGIRDVTERKSLENLRTATNLLKVYLIKKKLIILYYKKEKKILTYFCT